MTLPSPSAVSVSANTIVAAFATGPPFVVLESDRIRTRPGSRWVFPTGAARKRRIPEAGRHPSGASQPPDEEGRVLGVASRGWRLQGWYRASENTSSNTREVAERERFTGDPEWTSSPPTGTTNETTADKPPGWAMPCDRKAGHLQRPCRSARLGSNQRPLACETAALLAQVAAFPANPPDPRVSGVS